MKNWVIISSLITALCGCSDNEAVTSSSRCFFPDAPQVPAPVWICEQVHTPQLITEVGMAPASSAGVSFSKSMAMADARVKLAQRLRQQGDISNVNDVTLDNSRPLNMLVSPGGSHYVQVGINPSAR